MNEPTAFNALCDLWTSHFNIMLTCVTILAGLFGLGGPLMFSIFQRQNLKDERERLNKEMSEKFAELKEQREQLNKETAAKFVELEKQQDIISQHDLRINELQTDLRNAHVSLAQYYSDKGLGLLEEIHSQGAGSVGKLGIAIFDMINALNCLARSGRKDNIEKCMLNFMKFTKDVTSNTKLLTDTVKELSEAVEYNTLALRTEDLEKIVGAENSTYQDFLKSFAPLFDSLKKAYGK